MTTTQTAGTEGQRKERSDAHTPGPWECQEGNGHIKVFGQLPQTGAYLIAEVITDDRKGTVFFEADRANAALIAAAPELLKALEGMLEWARRVTQRNPGMEVANAVNAIAKAKGGA